MKKTNRRSVGFKKPNLRPNALCDLYERIVEGKDDIPEVVEPLKYVTKQEILTSNLDFDKLIADLKNAEQIWNQHIETDDEEILLLL